MWSSRLPTGTICDEQLASRTFPRSTHEPASQPSTAGESTTSPPSRSTETATTEVERLRAEKREAIAEIQQLESQVESLRSQVQRHQKAKQAIVDRYERLIAELEVAAATRPSEPTGSETADKRQPHEQGLIDRLKNWL